jgi:signal transduction histidine kinase
LNADLCSPDGEGWTKDFEVAARLHTDGAEMSVADTGIGIAPADQDVVFEEFRQVGAADKKAEGTGPGWPSHGSSSNSMAERSG